MLYARTHAVGGGSAGSSVPGAAQRGGAASVPRGGPDAGGPHVQTVWGERGRVAFINQCVDVID